MLIAAFFIIAPNWKNPNANSKGMGIQILLYSYNGKLLSNKKEKSLQYREVSNISSRRSQTPEYIPFDST